MAIEWNEGSAGKHGVTRDEALYAISNHHLWIKEFDDSRVGGVRPDLYMGPSRLGGPLLEIMTLRVPPRTVVIFHAMPAREKYLMLLEEEE